jgi:hypothetical protein
MELMKMMAYRASRAKNDMWSEVHAMDGAGEKKRRKTATHVTTIMALSPTLCCGIWVCFLPSLDTLPALCWARWMKPQEHDGRAKERVSLWRGPV